jgi:hypothetical protein
VSVAKPTLDEVFLAITGRGAEENEGPAADNEPDLAADNEPSASADSALEVQ